MARSEAARAAASSKDANGPRRVDQAGQLIGAKATPATSVPQVSQDHRAQKFGARRRRPGDAGRASFRHAHDPIPSDGAARCTTSITDVPATSDDRLLITLEARGREKFDALFNGKRIVQAGSQPICDAARILHRLGHDDDVLLVARHQGANHDAIHGPLGVWRHLRVREDRGGPRYAKWEPFPSRPVRAKERPNRSTADRQGVDEKNASGTPPGAGKAHSLGPVAQKSAIYDPGRGNG
jgi:hypothetical protein